MLKIDELGLAYGHRVEAIRRTAEPGGHPRVPVTVLIADDDAEFSAAVREVIESRPRLRLVGSAVDAESAIQMCRRYQPDVAILDLRMPGGGGVAAARRLAVDCRRTRVIALSAFGDPRSVRQMTKAGAVEYLVKGRHSSTEIVEAILRTAHPSVAPV